MSPTHFDDEGFLVDLNLWNEALATSLAEKEGVTLSPEHFDVLYAARRYQASFDLSPEMRPLVKWVGQELGKDKGNSIYLMTLFPQSTAKLVSKIAGLPKPLNCI